MAISASEVLVLSIDDLSKMKVEFPDIYEQLFNSAYKRLRKTLELKLEGLN